MTALTSSTIRVASQVIIRRGSPADAALLAQLGARTFSDTFAAHNSPADMADYLASAFGESQQASELMDPHCTFLIAEQDAVAIGYAMLSSHAALDCVTGARPMELVRLYVSQDCLGSGIGARLMQSSIDETRGQGFDTLWLGVWEHNHRAKTFYSKWNFQTVGTHVFQLGEDAQTDYLMQLVLK